MWVNLDCLHRDTPQNTNLIYIFMSQTCDEGTLSKTWGTLFGNFLMKLECYSLKCLTLQIDHHHHVE